MIIFPAIDLRGGKVVRLRQGKKDQVTVFNDDPLETAKLLADCGAEFLHIIDLDAAFADSDSNKQIIKKIASSLKIPVQTGGGIRSLKICAEYLDAGVNRLIVGTMALEKPELFQKMCRAFPGKAGVSLDAEDGVLKTRGWLANSGMSLTEAVNSVEEAGASFIIYTDISRDGMRKGVNLAALENLLKLTGLPVIGAGGVASLEDIKQAWQLSKKGGLAGLVTGKAIYDGSLDLREAVQWLKNAGN